MRRGAHDLAHGFGECLLRELRGGLGGACDRGELHHGIGPQLEVRTRRRNGDGVLVVGEGDRTGFQPAHNVGREPGGNDTGAVVHPDHLFCDLDRQIEIGSGHREDIAGTRKKKTGQHR